MTNIVETIARALEHNSQLRGWVSYESDAAAALKAISDTGYVVVPREPTEAMLEAGLFEAEGCTDRWTSAAACLPKHVWAGMLKASTTEEI